MKLEVGMYVRTKVGKIAKIINKYDNSGSLHKENFVWVLDDSSVLALHSQKVVKASYNIIDLIEVGDYVNGYKVVDFSETYFNGVDRREKPKRIGLKVINGKFDYENYIEADEIKDIVTKEQFESMKYEVKG